MSEERIRSLTGDLGESGEDTDAIRQTFQFGDGGVPWLLLIGYLSFLVFFAWYSMGFQLPAFVGDGDGAAAEAVEATAGE